MFMAHASAEYLLFSSSSVACMIIIKYLLNFNLIIAHPVCA